MRSQVSRSSLQVASVGACGFVVALVASAAAQQPAPPAASSSAPTLRAPVDLRTERTGWIEVPGTLFLCGGGKLGDEVLGRFVRFAGGDKGRLIVIPSASRRADEDDPAATEASKDRWAELVADWKRRGLGEVEVLHAKSREAAKTIDFGRRFEKATAVWFGGGSQARLVERYRGSGLEKAMHALLARGGVVGGTSAGAACMSRTMIAGGKAPPRMGRGFDVLPAAIIDQHFKERAREARLVAALDKNPGCWGVGLDEGTALVVRGRRMMAFGRGKVTLLLRAGKRRKAWREEIKPRRGADLVAMQRAAHARTQPAFPPKPLPKPIVAKGSVIMVGGGRVPAVIWQRFLKAAGGLDAPIVVVPTAIGRVRPGPNYSARALKRAGASNVSVWHAERRSQLDEPEFVAPLRKAKGVWFGGGRQWRLVDRYEGTLAKKLFDQVLERGGVIGGSSAGTSIQAQYMVRGNPLGNRDMMAEGYERGFGFLRGVAVDQHFAQRRRYADLASVVRRFPWMLGIGVDESTAIHVQNSVAEIIGRGNVAFYDWSSGKPVGDEGRDHLRLGPGWRYDLVRRVALESK